MKKRVPQADRSKEEATANIDRKIEVLRSWVMNGVPYLVDPEGHLLLDKKETKILDYYPGSLRNFKEWNGSQNCEAVRASLPKIAGTGNDTLGKRPEKEQIVRQLIQALKLRVEEQLAAGRHTELKRLKLELNAVESLLKLRQSEFRTQRLRILQLEKENQRLIQRYDNDIAQYKRTFIDKDSDIERLKRENSELINRISKVHPLRSTRSDD